MLYRLSSYPTAQGRRCAGFTLAELLVVVAIVAVLVAIAIPVFTGAVTSAEEATCDANRRSVKGMYTNAWLLDQEQDKNKQPTLFEKCVAQLKEQNNDVLCPNRGEYQASFNEETGAVIIKCTVHGMTDEDEMLDVISNHQDWWSGTNTDDRNVIWKAYKELTGKESWPVVEGKDGGTLYLKFKSYNGKSSGVFLYASSKGPTVNDNDAWKTNYICDSTGLLGKPGQWYEVSKDSNIALGKDGVQTLLKTGTPVNLVGNKFDAA